MAAAKKDIWRKKYKALKWRCDEIEANNQLLYMKLLELYKLMKTVEDEKGYLMSRLESFEQLQYSASDEEEEEEEEEEIEVAEVKDGESANVSPLHPLTDTSLPSSPRPVATPPHGGKSSGPPPRKKQAIDLAAPKKPKNAFLRFFQEHKSEYTGCVEGEGLAKHHEVTKALAKVWQETKPEDKKKYYDLYQVDKDKYEQELRNYNSRNTT